MFEGPQIIASQDTGTFPSEGSQRRVQRESLEAEVMLRRAGRSTYRVDVYDISPKGCCVEFVERPTFREILWVKFDGLEAIPAEVRWTGGPVAGLEFPRPIHPAVFDMLLRRLKPHNIAGILPVR